MWTRTSCSSATARRMARTTASTSSGKRPFGCRARFPILRRRRSRRLVAGLDFGGDDQSFFVGDIDRKRRATTRPYRRVTLFHRQFNIVGVKVAATDDDQILQATGDKQLAIFQESQIPGAEKRSLTGIFQVGLESCVRFPRVGSNSPESRSGRTPRFRPPHRVHKESTIPDRTMTISGIEQGVATSDQCPHILLLVGGLHDAVLFKRCHLCRAEHGLIFQKPAGNHQRGFGESITRIEEARAETTGGKGRRKPFHGVRADWLRAVVSHIPTAEVESFTLLRSNPASAQFIGEIGAAADGGFVARNGLEPPHRPLRKDCGGIRITRTSLDTPVG